MDKGRWGGNGSVEDLALAGFGRENGNDLVLGFINYYFRFFFDIYLKVAEIVWNTN